MARKTEQIMITIMRQGRVKKNITVSLTIQCDVIGWEQSEMSSWTALTRHLGMKTTF